MSQALLPCDMDIDDGTLLPAATIARSFGRAARGYDAHAVLQRQVADKLLERLPDLGQASRILELGSGTGYCTQRLQQRYQDSDVVALDIALPMLQQTGKVASMASLLCADAEMLPLANNCIDLVFSSLTMQWCEHSDKLFAELARVLKPGGKALLSTFGPASLSELRQAWEQVDAYMHVNNFTSLKTLLNQAHAAGLTPLIECEQRQDQHASLYTLSRELKGIGAHNLNRQQNRGLTTPRRFRQAAAQFAKLAKDDGKVAVSWEIYYLDLGRP